MMQKIRNILIAIIGIYAFAIILESVALADFGIFENSYEYNLFSLILVLSASALNWKLKKEEESEYV